jgi:hypothetical protein
MSSSQMDDLAERFAKLSLRNDHSSKATVPKESPDAEDGTQPPRASLMGIPGELRNQIFEYVYNTPDEPSHYVNMRVRIGPFKPHDSEYLLRPLIELSEAPTRKPSIFVCRQLYAEMRTMMDDAAFLKFHTNIFRTTVPEFAAPPMLRGFDAPEDKGLRHVEHFVVCPNPWNEEDAVDIRFEAGRWNAYVEVTQELWSSVIWRGATLGSQPLLPRGRHRLINFEREMHANTSCDHGNDCACGRISDPKLGRGLTARYIWIAQTIVKKLISEGQSPWTPAWYQLFN